MGEKILSIDDEDVTIKKDELLELVGLDEEDIGDDEKGRKDYCCRFGDGSSHTVRASHSVSAMLKCQRHKPMAPVTVSKGSC